MYRLVLSKDRDGISQLMSGQENRYVSSVGVLLCYKWALLCGIIFLSNYSLLPNYQLFIRLKSSDQFGLLVKTKTSEMFPK